MRIAADVGGTFTDIVVQTAVGRFARKVPSTPDAFERGVIDAALAGVTDGQGALADVVAFRHATTVATNAVLERQGPRTGLVTTEGFRDVLELGRLRTPSLYDLGWRKPPALAPRRFRVEIAERMLVDGTALVKPDLESLRPRLDELVGQQVTGLAVSLLNAYVNPEHEELVAEWISREYPGLHVTVATHVVRELGEYERTSTAVLNAYLQPVAARYLRRLSEGLFDAGCTAPVLVMQSSGGMTPVLDAERFPAHILESGPAAGVLAAAALARAAGLPHAISFDMGGTTAKAALLQEYAVAYATEFSVGSDVSSATQLLRSGGYLVRLPVVDLAEVGAGGGSIATVDAAGGLAVGPRSAGADPGPACYGRGGVLATITDANLVLGYLNPAGLRAGGVAVDHDRARAAIDQQIGRPLGLTVEQAAAAVHAVADRQMARALRAVTTERGHDITEQTLIAFGGSGPLHAATLADVVGIRRVVVPPLAGVYSSVGLLDTPLELARSFAVGLPLAARSVQPLRLALADAAAGTAQRFTAAGLEVADAELTRMLDLRYRGQGTELTLPGPDVVDEAAIAALAELFTERHRRAYGHVIDDEIEVVRVRVTATAPPTDTIRGGVRTAAAEHGVRPAYFDDISAVPVLTRSALAGATPGPILVDDPDTTTVVPPGWTASADADGNLRLERAP